MTWTESPVADDSSVDGLPVNTPDPAAAGPGAVAPDLGARLAALETGLAAVVDRLADDAARAAARERVIDRQHAEIERLRAAERSGLLRPVVTDLYRLRNDLLRQAGRSPDTITGERLGGLLSSYADSLAEALERCGVQVLPCAPGAAFEPGRHQAAGVTPTDDPALDGTIAEVVQDGYTDTDSARILAPARVTLYRLQEDRLQEDRLHGDRLQGDRP